jgi:hypothetical protein
MKRATPVWRVKIAFVKERLSKLFRSKGIKPRLQNFAPLPDPSLTGVQTKKSSTPSKNRVEIGTL